MNHMSDLTPVLMFLAGAFGFSIYIPFVLYLRRSSRIGFARRRFCRGVVAVLHGTDDLAVATAQIEVIFKNLEERYTAIKGRFRSVNDMIEDLLVALDTSDPKAFKAHYGMEVPSDFRGRLYRIRTLLKQEQPFATLTSKQAQLLTQLRGALETNNRDFGANLVTQLGTEFEVLEGNVRQQAQRGHITFLVSMVGAVLTLFFGLVSFLQFFAALSR